MQYEKRMIELIKLIRGILIIGFVTAIGVSGYQFWQIQSGYQHERAVYNTVVQFKPVLPKLPSIETEEKEAFFNQDILDLQAKYEDAVGWITVPNTGIDYPFVQAADNSFYLRKDITGEYALTGTIFMDYRNDKAFSDFSTILYGHHMKNGTMFGSLKSFNNKDFFLANNEGTIFLADRTYAIEFFAYLIVRHNDDIIYGVPSDNAERLNYINHVKETARHYIDIGVAPADQIITLSTCAYEFKNARMVLIGKISDQLS